MEKIKLTGKHILLLLLYSPGHTNVINEPITGRTRIIKSMFLFDKEIKNEFCKDSNIKLINFPEFYSWKFGPFSKEIYNDIEFFINNGFLDELTLDTLKSGVELDEYENWEEDYLLEDILNENVTEPFEETFKLSNKGVEFIQGRYYDKLTKNQKKTMKRFKSSVNKSSLGAILRYTYLKYPDFTDQSVIKGKILG